MVRKCINKYPVEKIQRKIASILICTYVKEIDSNFISSTDFISYDLRDKQLKKKSRYSSVSKDNRTPKEKSTKSEIHVQKQSKK